MNSSLDSLVKNIPEEAFKYTSTCSVFQGEQLDLKERVYILMILWIALINLILINYLKKKTFTVF